LFGILVVLSFRKPFSMPTKRTHNSTTSPLTKAPHGDGSVASPGRDSSNISKPKSVQPFGKHASLVTVSIITINDCTLSPDLLAVLENASREKKAATPAPALSSKTLMSSSYSASGE
jgi:hypothetical protein